MDGPMVLREETSLNISPSKRSSRGKIDSFDKLTVDAHNIDRAPLGLALVNRARKGRTKF
jgi:hypothetical protein